MTASCLSVLRFSSLGESDAFVSLLTRRLVDHFKKKTSPNTTASTLQIANKYFSADVALRRVGSDGDEGAVLKEDGIVLLADSNQGDLRALDPVHERAEEAGGGDLLRLCVILDDGNSSVETKTPKEIEEDYSKKVLWCLDRGYEYVPMCDLSDEGVLRGHEDRDKEGFARLVEAIQGTVWSSAVMASKTKQKTTQSRKEEIKNEPASNTYEPPDPSKLPPLSATTTTATKESDSEREEKARQALLLQATEKESAGYLDGEGDEATLKQRREEVATERLFDEFEGAIKEASRIRDISRSGQLSDEERRKRAGDAALVLIDLMGKMGYDDEEEDDSDADEVKEEKTTS